MRLLFDANLSPKLVKQLADLFPGSVHLFDLPLARNVADSAIWTYAKQNWLDIITTDGGDYPPMVQRLGPPPKVILFRVGDIPRKSLSDWFAPTQFRSRNSQRATRAY